MLVIIFSLTDAQMSSCQDGPRCTSCLNRSGAVPLGRSVRMFMLLLCSILARWMWVILNRTTTANNKTLNLVICHSRPGPLKLFLFFVLFSHQSVVLIVLQYSLNKSLFFIQHTSSPVRGALPRHSFPSLGLCGYIPPGEKFYWGHKAAWV